MNMIIIPIVALVIMTFAVLFFKAYLKFTGGFFKFIIILLYLLNFFFLYWGPHISKGQSGFVEWSDMWYIVVVAVLSIIIPLATLGAIKSNKDQGI